VFANLIEIGVKLCRRLSMTPSTLPRQHRFTSSTMCGQWTQLKDCIYFPAMLCLYYEKGKKRVSNHATRRRRGEGKDGGEGEKQGGNPRGPTVREKEAITQIYTRVNMTIDHMKHGT
jgi:hypothetical protein